MANARKCDRCGGFFDPTDMKGMSCRFSNPMFQNENDIREGMIGKLMLNGSPDIYADLCPECAEMFEAFMCGADLPEKNEMQRQIEKLVRQTDELGKENIDFRKKVERLEYENNWIRTENDILNRLKNPKKDSVNSLLRDQVNDSVKRRRPNEQKG